MSLEVLFLDARDDVLVRRYSETRRQHPLAPSGNLLDGIRRKREHQGYQRASGLDYRHLGYDRAPAASRKSKGRLRATAAIT